MAYLGNRPATGENNAFRILDDISSHVVSFNGSSASVVSVSADTITIAGSEHRYITGQKVTYSKGGGTVITGLTDATAYYVIKDSDTTIQLATTASNATNGVAVNLTGLGAGTAHTLTLAFDGTNTKFKPTYNDGSQNPIITRAAQLVLSLNGVIQQPVDSASPSSGFGIDVSGNIIFSTAPDANDDFWGHVHASNTVTFDISDNDIDNFTGDGSTANFNLSKTPPDNRNILVTLDGVIQYPSDNSNTRAYTLSENELQMVSAPASGVAIQVRHIGFAGASGGSGGVSGFYGRTGNVVLKSTDNPVVGNLTAVDGTFSGNVSIAKTLTYMDVAHIDAVGVITAQNDVNFNGSGAGISSSYWDSSANSLKFKDNVKAEFGDSQDLSIYHSGSHSFIKDTGTGMLKICADMLDFRNAADSATLAYAQEGNKFELFHNGNSRLVTTGTGVNITDNLNVAGVSTFAGYINLAQKIIHTGDADTSIEFDTNTIKFETTGVERLRIDSTGILKLYGDNGNNSVIYGHRAGSLTYILGNQSGSNDFNIKTWASSTNIIFSIAGNNEKVRIDSNGNLGLGDNGPSNFTNYTNLSIHGSSGGAITFGDDGTDEWEIYGGDGAVRIYDRANTTERFRIANDGEVGIGTDLSGASGKFQVFGTNTVLARFGNTISSTYEAISIKNTVAGYPAVCNDSSSDTLDLRSMGSVQVTIDSNNNSTGKYFRVMNNAEGGAGTELFRVRDDGHIGIGTATPAGGSSLHIHGSGASDKNHIRLSADRGLIARLGDTSGSAQAMFDLYGTDGSTQIVRFISGGGDNWINTGGDFGVGKSNPSFALDVEKASDSTFRISNSGETGHGSHDAKIVAGGSYYQNPNIVGSAIKFSTYNGSSEGERLRIDSNGYLSFAGDTNTYIWHPQADQIAITRAGGSFPIIRFGSGGAGGTVAIGNTTANLVTNSEILSVRGYSSFKSVNNNYAAIYTHNEGNTSGTYNAHILWNAGGANRGGIGYMPNTGELTLNHQYNITFRTGGSQFSGTERLRITSAGKVGIGTDNPHELLHIGNDSGTPGGLKISGQSNSVTDEGLTIDWTASNEARFFSESAASTTMKFYTTSSGTRGLRHFINSNGNTDIYANQVHLYNSVDTSNTYFVAQNTGAGNAGIKLKNNQGEWTIIANDRLRFIDDDAGVERLSLASDGGVGINKTSPNAGLKLHVGGTARFDDDVSIMTGKKLFTNSSQGQLTIQGGATYPGSAIKFAGGQSGATDRGKLKFYSSDTTSLVEVAEIRPDKKVQGILVGRREFTLAMNDNSSWNYCFTVHGNSLGSQVEVRINGTRNNTVFNGHFHIIGTHSNPEYLVTSFGATYSAVYMKMVGDNYGNYNAYFKRGGQTGACTANVRVYPRNNEYIDQNEDSGYSGTAMEVTAHSGMRIWSSINSSADLDIEGTLSKGGGTFKIPHPLTSLKDTKHLVHSFIEGPSCDLIYRGTVTLSSGSATVNIDTVAGMTAGTFAALNKNVQCFTSNESGWGAVKGSVSGSTLTITAQDGSSTDNVSWMVVGQRQDDVVKSLSMTDDNGDLILEPSIDPTEDSPSDTYPSTIADAP